MLLEETAAGDPPSGTGILKSSGVWHRSWVQRSPVRTVKHYPSLTEAPVVKAQRVVSKIIFEANFGYCTVKRLWGSFAHTAVNEKVLIMQQLPDSLERE